MVLSAMGAVLVQNVASRVNTGVAIVARGGFGGFRSGARALTNIDIFTAT